VKVAVPKTHVSVAMSTSSWLNVTDALVSQVAVTVRLWASVTLSVAEAPVSEAEARSGVPGAAAVVSIVTERALEFEETTSSELTCRARRL
jgi:hypothetical protein